MCVAMSANFHSQAEKKNYTPDEEEKKLAEKRALCLHITSTCLINAFVGGMFSPALFIRQRSVFAN